MRQGLVQEQTENGLILKRKQNVSNRKSFGQWKPVCLSTLVYDPLPAYHGNYLCDHRQV